MQYLQEIIMEKESETPTPDAHKSDSHIPKISVTPSEVNRRATIDLPRSTSDSPDLLGDKRISVNLERRG